MCPSYRLLGKYLMEPFDRYANLCFMISVRGGGLDTVILPTDFNPPPDLDLFEEQTVMIRSAFTRTKNRARTWRDVLTDDEIRSLCDYMEFAIERSKQKQ